MNDLLSQLALVIDDHKICLSEDDILEFLKITNRWPHKNSYGAPSMEVITQYDVNFTGEIFNNFGIFLYDEWKKKYDCGFTSILSDVLDLSNELRELDCKLSKFLGKKSYANFYFSKGSNIHRVSFPPHTHNYDVIVKMIYGKCIWKIDGNYVHMENNTTIIPAGTEHSVVECLDKKLSLTININ